MDREKKLNKDVTVIGLAFAGIFIFGLILVLVSSILIKRKPEKSLFTNLREIISFIDFDDIEELFYEDYTYKESYEDEEKQPFKKYVDENTVSKETTSSSRIKINNNTYPDLPYNRPLIEKETTDKDTCIEYEITEGKFISTGCYKQSDLNDLRIYLTNYKATEIMLDAAIRNIDITCDSDWDPFITECEKATELKEQAEKELIRIEKLINTVIEKGK